MLEVVENDEYLVVSMLDLLQLCKVGVDCWM